MFRGVDQGEPSAAWTAERVEARLVEAFRRLPDAPVYSTGGRLQSGIMGGSDPMTDALAWPRRFIAGERERLILMTWARLRAAGGRQFAAFCLEKDWQRSTVEKARRRAAARIAACLNSE